MEANETYFLGQPNASLTQIFNFLTSKFWLQKCCIATDIFSLYKNSCIMDDGKDPLGAELVSKSFGYGTRYGLPPSTNSAAELRAVTSYQFWENGTICDRNGSKTLCFELGYYCFDFVVEQNKLQPFYGALAREEFDLIQFTKDFVIQFFFFLSLLLAIVTLILFLGLSVLRQKIYGKCFICYLITHIVMLLTAYVIKIRWKIGDDDRVENVILYFTCLSVIFWLNAMSFRLWRSIRSMKQIPEGKLHYYALYAWGCPLILSGINIIKQKISKKSAFINEIGKGKYFELVNIVAYVLIINLCLFFHVAIIIWQQNKRWKGNAKFRCRRPASRQHHKQLFIIFKLFSIMGIVEWNHFFCHAYYKYFSPTFQFISVLIIMCPGFAIFIVYICCNKKVISELKKKFITQSDIRGGLQNVEHCNVGNETASETT